MATIKAALVGLAALLTLTSCGDPGQVVKKSTEGQKQGVPLEVTGEHYVWCKRTKRTVKVRVTYKEYVSIRIGDPC